MKCDKCGYEVNPGDQICINCHSKLNLNDITLDGYDKVNEYIDLKGNINEKKNNKVIIYTSLGIVILIILVFIILKLFVLR